MNHYASSASLKARARQSLLGHYLTFSGAFITLWILQYVIVVPANLMQLSPPFGMVFYYAGTFCLELFFAIFQAGLAFMFLSNACGQHVSSGSLFSSFWGNPARVIKIQLVPSLLLLLPHVLPSILLNQFFRTAKREWLLYFLVLTLLFLPVRVYIRILYSQVFYIMLDFPEMEPLACLRQSRRLMQGNKLRYFYIMLSFLPLSLLGVCSCGIGLFYVYPYREQTYANFYLDLVAVRQSGDRH